MDNIVDIVAMMSLLATVSTSSAYWVTECNTANWSHCQPIRLA